MALRSNEGMMYRKGRPMVDGELLFAEDVNLDANATYPAKYIGTGNATGTFNVSGAPVATGSATFTLYGSYDAAGTDTKTKLAEIAFTEAEVHKLLTVPFSNQVQDATTPLPYISVEATVTTGFNVTMVYVSEPVSTAR